jgi:hypothetical protein
MTLREMVAAASVGSWLYLLFCHGEIIDDCALGRAAKQDGPIWLGLSGPT